MKLKTKLTSCLLCLFLTVSIWAQQGDPQAFWVHEDQVKPSMMMEYENTSKDLVSACKTNNIKNIQWSVASMDDGTYLSISPIKDLADIQNSNFEELREKLGDEKFNRMFENFNKCYDNHGDYVTTLIPNLSYMPDGLSTSTPGQDYRVWHRLDVTPANIQKLQSKLKAIKDLYASKNSKIHYRIYRSGFGNVGDYYVAVISAKDAMDYDTRTAENQKLMGEEGQKLFNEMFEYVDSYSVKRGSMRPDLGYAGTAQNSNVNTTKE